MIAIDLSTFAFGDAEWLTEQDFLPAFRTAMSGVSFLKPGLEEPAMFKLPAYDPLVIAWLGFGILAITALAFVT